MLTSAESWTSTPHQGGVYPLQVIAVDILGPLSESDGGNILVAGDYFAKWMEVYAIHNGSLMTRCFAGSQPLINFIQIRASSTNLQ